LIARLFASLPPLVKTTSSVLQPSSEATLARPPSTAARATDPARYCADGLLYPSSSNGLMTAATLGSIGVLAL
jgi:hypothetical protein